jgi:hypothetical protein
LYKLTPNDLETAMKYFELAKEKTPEYAPAYVGISFVWVGLLQMGHISPEEAGPKIMEALTKALELDSTNAEVIYTQACINTWMLWDWEGGESAFKKVTGAQSQSCGSTCILLAFPEYYGETRRSHAEIEIALKLDPHNPLLISLYTVLIYYLYVVLRKRLKVAKEAFRMQPVSPVAQTVLT